MRYHMVFVADALLGVSKLEQSSFAGHLIRSFNEDFILCRLRIVTGGSENTVTLN